GQVPEVLVDRAVVRGQPELHRHVHEGLVGGAGVAFHQQADVVHGRLERGRDGAAVPVLERVRVPGYEPATRRSLAYTHSCTTDPSDTKPSGWAASPSSRSA